MGVGLLAGWHLRWELLPLALENTWGQMENLCARRLTKVRQIQEESALLVAPAPDWDAFGMQSNPSGTSVSNIGKPAPDELSNPADRALIVPLDAPGLKSQFDIVINWHSRLKAAGGPIPNAVFMGGLPEQSYLAVYKRALNASDFVDLWSL
jgi:hypothetical protein